MNPVIENNKPGIEGLCKTYHVKELYVFGSVLRPDFSENSDIDFLVIFNDNLQKPLERVENEDALKQSLENLLQKDVDLIQYNLIRNKYLRYFINQEKQLLYAEA